MVYELFKRFFHSIFSSDEYLYLLRADQLDQDTGIRLLELEIKRYQNQHQEWGDLISQDVSDLTRMHSYLYQDDIESVYHEFKQLDPMVLSFLNKSLLSWIRYRYLQLQNKKNFDVDVPD